MRSYEIPKGKDEPRDGKIMMAIEGYAGMVESISALLAGVGFPSTDCSEEGEKEGEIAEMFMIKRGNKADFMAEFKRAKSLAQ